MIRTKGLSVMLLILELLLWAPWHFFVSPGVETTGKNMSTSITLKALHGKK